jgi:dihydrofolate reductase
MSTWANDRSGGATTEGISTMATVEANISISLDGYVTGPGVEQTPGLGEGGEALHTWIHNDIGRQLIDGDLAAAGAVITSRRVYEDTGGWGDDGLYQKPVFVVTHRRHEPVVKGSTTFTFVTDGVTAAVAQAVEAAGDKLVHIMGGASIIRQAMDADLVDRLRLHLVPILLGSGTRLFRHGAAARLRLIDNQDTPEATHLTYQVAHRSA